MSIVTSLRFTLNFSHPIYILITSSAWLLELAYVTGSFGAAYS